MYKKLIKKVEKEIDKIFKCRDLEKIKFNREQAKEVYLQLHILLNCISEPIYRAAGNIAYDFNLHKKEKK